jgi:hypothetical protein
MRYRFFLLFLCFTTLANAREVIIKSAPKGKVSLKVDSSRVIVRNFDQQALTKYSRQPEFIYDQVAPIRDTLWFRFWRGFWNLMSKIFSGSIAGNLIKYLILALLTGIVIYLILKVGGLEFKIFSGKSKSMEVPYDESTENIHEINFEEEIQKALDHFNYRLAVRLFYLRALKLLNDQELIHWQPEKTNQTYVNELKDIEKQSQFALLTREFEYVWYGDFSIEKEGFIRIQEDFQRFNHKGS